MGIPHSDPVADGPVIQTTSQRALEKELPLLWLWKLAKRKNCLTFDSYDLWQHRLPVWIFRFAQILKMPGFRLIIADFPWEARHFEKKWKDTYPVLLALLLLPGEDKTDCQRERGFVYLVSGKGTTGQVDGEERLRSSRAYKRSIFFFSAYRFWSELTRKAQNCLKSLMG